MKNINDAKKMISQSNNIVAFTGAGVSTESNIPDFRSVTGLYNNEEKYGYPPEEILSKSFFDNSPEAFYRYYKSNLVHIHARPNDCHHALCELEKKGKLKAVVTQNIDGLDRLAGTVNVLELHGSVYRNYCINCSKKYGVGHIVNCTGPVPLCKECGGIIRPDIVLYEEQLDSHIINRAVNAIRCADILIVIGTSLVVYPAAGLLHYYRGDNLILVNKTPTAFDSLAKIVINDKAGPIMIRLAGDFI